MMAESITHDTIWQHPYTPFPPAAWAVMLNAHTPQRRSAPVSGAGYVSKASVHPDFLKFTRGPSIRRNSAGSCPTEHPHA